jgi:hypothetical protein
MGGERSLGERMRGVFARRGVVVLLAVLLSLSLAIGAYATVGRHSPNPKKASTAAGDTTARFHGDAETSCDLPAGVTALSANWNHGQYVSAWAKWAADQRQQGLSTTGSAGGSVATAAQSDCGKPLGSLSGQSVHGQSGKTHGKSAEAHSHKDAHTP